MPRRFFETTTGNSAEQPILSEDEAGEPKSRKRRLATTFVFTTIFFAGASLAAVAGDQLSRYEAGTPVGRPRRPTPRRRSRSGTAAALLSPRGRSSGGRRNGSGRGHCSCGGSCTGGNHRQTRLLRQSPRGRHGLRRPARRTASDSADDRRHHAPTAAAPLPARASTGKAGNGGKSGRSARARAARVPRRAAAEDRSRHRRPRSRARMMQPRSG